MRRSSSQQAFQPTAVMMKAEWNSLTVEYGRLDAIGEFDFAMPKNMISVAFIPHEEVTWSVDRTPPQTTALPAGSVFVYGDREFVWHRRSKPSEYVNVAIDPAFLQQIVREQELSNQTELEHRVIFQDATILQIAQLLKAEVISGGIAGNLYVESLRNVLAIHLLRNYTATPVKPIAELNNLDRLKLQHLKDYIEDHLADELTIASLAELIPMSQFHFARAFKAAIGEPPHRYIMRRRIERAKVLLSVTQLSTVEVAYQVGFSNQSHFTAQFRKVVGLTPGKFRAS